MDFSRISNRAFLGQAIRMPLKLIPADMPMPILQGRLRGKRWITGAHTHGCWLGSYEFCKRLQFEQLIQPGQFVFDIGANAGFYSLLASVLVGPAGRVFAFEPATRNIAHLRRHLRINNMSNVIVLEAAVSDRSGAAFFDATSGGATAHLDEHGALLVKTVA